MPYKDRQEKQEYQREWARRKRNGLKTSGIKQRRIRTEEEIEISRERRKAKSRERTQRINTKASEIFGENCYFCGSPHRLGLHRKDGVPHKNMFLPPIAMNAPDEWVKLCGLCHRAVHWNMKHLNMDWVQIERNYN
jgi:hypothetical protein